MKLTSRPPHARAKHAGHDAVVHRVIDLTGPVATEKLVINLTATPFFVDKPGGSDGPSSKILLTLPDGRVSLLPAPGTRWKRHGRHAKRGALAALRRAVRSRRRGIDALTVLAITVVVGVGLVMGTVVVAFRR